MSEIPDVVGGETILTSWGNPIRDRVISRYADATERATLVPVPIVGDPSYLTAAGSLEVYDGAAWIPYVRGDGGTFTGAIEFEEWISFPIAGRGVQFFSGTDQATLSLIGGDTIRVRISSSGITSFAVQSVGDTDKFRVGHSAGVFTVPVTFHSSALVVGTFTVGAETTSRIDMNRQALSGLVRFVISSENALFIQISPDGSAFNTRLTVAEEGLTIGAAALNLGVARNVFTGTAAPSAGLGDVGDVYIRVQ